MNLPRLFHTTSFRLTLLYAGLFCTSVLILFGTMFWFGTGYIAGEIDKTVSNELTEVRQSAVSQSLKGLADIVSSYSRRAPPGNYYLLQDAKGYKLAGNIHPFSPELGLRNWDGQEAKLLFPGALHGVRGRAVQAPYGAILFFGIDNFSLIEMRELVWRAFVWGLLATVLLAIAGGTVMSLGLLHHVEAISQTSREIVAGDLSRRIPMRGIDDEFDHLASSLNAMLERIESLMDGLRQVSSDIAHDLRTPLSRLRQRLELAQRRPLTQREVSATLATSIADVDAILDTFGALLRIAQIEAHTRATEFATVDLTQLLNDLVETYANVAEDAGHLALTADIAPGLFFRCDRELVPQLFANIIENAIRHCPRDSAISLRASQTGHHVQVTVADNGPGIPADMREKVFRRFFRLERSRTTDGTGLGLSLAAAIAGLHDATIELDDNRPGLCVRLAFPLPDRTI